MMNDFVLRLESDQPRNDLEDQLRQFEPWGHLIEFSNGASTGNLERRVPFAVNPTQKANIVFDSIQSDQLRGGRLLDIGCNSGYSSIFAATTYDMRPTGIDVNPRHIEVSTMLAGFANIDAEFKLADAETYTEQDEYDLVFHFGTLYHLPNPLMSLASTFRNLKSGGWVAIETQIYEGADPNECYYIHMHNNDRTNFWALSPSVLRSYMEFIGFESYSEILRVTPKAMEKEGMHRTISIARKP